jgi:hypothetical protein
LTCLLISGRFGRHVDASDAAVDDIANDDAADETPSEACGSCNGDNDSNNSSNDAKILHRVTTDAKNDNVVRERSKQLQLNAQYEG